MNFELNEEQRALADSVARLLADHYDFGKRRAILAAEPGFSEAVWKQMVDMGLAALPIPEADGGLGGGAADLMPVMQAFGRALVLEPLFASSVLGATALRLAADAATRAPLLEQVAAGTLRLAFAHDEAGAHHAPLWVETRARRQAGGWLLDGDKIHVLHAPATGKLVVSARIGGAPDERKGLALFLVDAGAPGLSCRAYRLTDDTRAGALQLRGVSATPLGDPQDSELAACAIDATRRIGIAASCADAVGAMEAAYELTVQYLNTRKQFGRLIGEYQALRHRAAEMLVSLELARSMAILAAVAIDDPESVDPDSDLARAKLVIARQGRSLCHNAIQLHGGIGMTEEMAVGHYLRRVVCFEQLFGDAQAQVAQLAQAV